MFRNLEWRVKQLENKIAVMEFEKKHPFGLALEENKRLSYRIGIVHEDELLYVKGGEIKHFKLPVIYESNDESDYWLLKEGIILKACTLHCVGKRGKTIYETYKFDINNEILIKIEKEEPKAKKGGKVK